ncbi:glycosyltransferase [Halomonas sp. LR3S48]|uniref:glycosyltransferase n=1 Tax=Halomonas sp. LR3S48 TaxID=2982694 RepID=UPI0021E4AAE2|nr:glycosyltransferase [Halomonas sp. LR3S48]UYG01943.1 glycosyltransferase [Halomonas sp. LR3S48]
MITKTEVAVKNCKVLFIIDHLDSGGAPVVIRDLIKGMARLGNNIDVLVLSNRVSHVLPEHVSLYKLPFVPVGKCQKLNRYRLHAQRLNEWLLSHQGKGYDLVLAHLHHAHQVVSRCFLQNKAWYCLHSDPVEEFLGNKNKFGRWVKKNKVRKLYNNKKVVGVSKGIVERLVGTIGCQVDQAVHIHNPIDIASIRELSEEPVSDVPDDYLLFVGRLDQRAKRFDRLLKGYRDSGVRLPLVIIGDGEGRKLIETMITNNGLEGDIILMGHRKNPYPYMKKAKGLILSSDYEGFSLVLAEALACGTPVVSTDCPSGPAEILVGELRHFLIEVGDEKGFACAIRKMVEKPPIVHDECMNGFDMESVANRYLSLVSS